jgi:DNA-directed RNA polymerase subunit RPC12/RpoP
MVLTCSDCGKKLTVPEGTAGQKVRCPGCQKVMTVPNRPVPASGSPAGGAAASTSTMRCAACKAPALQELPPNRISRHPGYVCSACGALMRPPQSTGMYVFLTLLGVGGVVLGVFIFVAVLAEGTFERRPLFGALAFPFIGGVVAVWCVQQLRLPMPLDAPRRRSRWLLWLVLFLVGLLLAGIALFGFAYFLHEML